MVGVGVWWSTSGLQKMPPRPAAEALVVPNQVGLDGTTSNMCVIRCGETTHEK